jgi:hypothetical protein
MLNLTRRELFSCLHFFFFFSTMTDAARNYALKQLADHVAYLKKVVQVRPEPSAGAGNLELWGKSFVNEWVRISLFLVFWG